MVFLGSKSSDLRGTPFHSTQDLEKGDSESLLKETFCNEREIFVIIVYPFYTKDYFLLMIRDVLCTIIWVQKSVDIHHASSCLCATSGPWRLVKSYNSPQYIMSASCVFVYRPTILDREILHHIAMYRIHSYSFIHIEKEIDIICKHNDMYIICSYTMRIVDMHCIYIFYV